ncbi:MAG: glycosyltransferase, partial [Firmicutes bacterium]|nr:glycosyltransferase [Bacillota bacterium]
NYGIKKAKGEYIGFVDSDDFVDETMFEKLYNKAKEKDYDIVACDLNYVYENKSKIKYCSCNIETDLLSKKDIKNNMINIYPTAWNKIYKKSIIKDLEFQKGIWYEDVEFIFRLFPHISSIGIVKEPLYQYIQREGAISKTYNDKVFDYIKNWNGIINYYKDNKLFKKYHEELEYSYVRYLYATMMKTLLKSRNKELIIEGLIKANNNVNKNFPNYKQNKYIKKLSIKNLYLKYCNYKIFQIIIKITTLRRPKNDK